MIDKSNITAVILAGGKGRRLAGQDKGLLEYRGKPLIQTVIDKIAPQVDHIIINANRNQKDYAEFGCPVISDNLSDFQGPLAGFAIALQSCNTDYILTLPCDGPNLCNDYVTRLINATKNKNTIVVAHDGEHLQAVHALIPISYLDNLLAFLNNGEREVKKWYAQNKIITVDFSDKPDAFFNINTEAHLLQEQHQQNQNKGSNND